MPLAAKSQELKSRILKGKYGYVDAKGIVVIPAKYDYARDFKEGLASVILDNKYGYIDQTGKEVIPLKYEVAGEFNEGLACVRLDNKYGYIDKKGKEIIALKYESAGGFAEGLAYVKRNKKYGYIDKTDKLIVGLIYDEANTFGEGLAAVRRNKKYGYIDKTGALIIGMLYDYTTRFYEGLAAVKNGGYFDGKFGFIDKAGNVVIPLKFDKVSSFDQGLATVEQNGRKYTIDYWGNEVKSDYKPTFIGYKLKSELTKIDKVISPSVGMQKEADKSTRNTANAKEKVAADVPLQFFTLLDSTVSYWKSIAEPQYFNDNLVAVVDSIGNVYAIVDGYGKKNILKLVNNRWISIARNFVDTEELLNDKNGNVYAKTKNGIYKIENDSCIKMPDDFDKPWKIVSEYDKDSDENYFKKYENGVWQKIPYPTSSRRNTKLKPICDDKGNLYVITTKGDGINRLFRYVNNQWTELYNIYLEKGESNDAKITTLPSYYTNFIVVRDTLYAVKKIYRNGNMGDVVVWKYTGAVWKVHAMQVANIPKKFNAGPSIAQLAYPKVNHYIFKENNKLGMQDEKGRVLVAPVFTRISSIETPAHILAMNELGAKLYSGNPNYCYQLVATVDTIYMQIRDTLPDMRILNGFGTKPGPPCIYCNGTVYEKDKTEKVKVRGNWVEEKTTTTSGLSTTEEHYDIATQKMVQVTKTPTTTKKTGGYYEDKYETKVIPGGKCKQCSKRPAAINREMYQYDGTMKFYVQKWIIGNP